MRILTLLLAALAATELSAAPPAIEVLETKVITPPSDYYAGWPTLTRLRDGRLMVVWSGRREGHVCPFGTVELMLSRNDGRTWTFPRTLLDSDIDDRDAGILETSTGAILATTFTSLAYEPGLTKAEQAGNWEPERLARWQGARDRLTPEERKADLGTWMIRSSDGGRTWSARYDCLVNSPHGPILLKDGTIFYPGKQLWLSNPRVGVAVSKTDGQTWEWLSEIPPRAGDDPNQYHELHGVECPSGKIVVQIRNHNAKNAGETLQTESTDGGRTWTEPHSIGVWGLPSHLLRLRDGRLLMSYGHRRPPFGNQVRFSRDEGTTWSEPAIVSGDGAGGDLGYPSTVELPDGRFVTVWYELLKGTSRAVLRQATWKEKPE